MLKKSEPGSGLLLHSAYNLLKTMLGEEDERPVVRNQREPVPADLGAPAWPRAASTHVRERQVLEALGEDRLTVRELTERVASSVSECRVYETNVRSVVYRLHRAHELDREPEPFKGHVRYRYFRNVRLDGPIADLARQFD